MRSPAFMETIQCEITNCCVLKCSNCTRFCGMHRTPFFMEEDLFHQAIDSLVGFVEKGNYGLCGIMGGEPLLHPKFAEFCDYAISKIPRERLGLWSTFPAGEKFARYREVICRTFGNVFLNDHTRGDVLHAPILMASEDYFQMPCPKCGGKDSAECERCGGKGTVTNDEELFLCTEKCWVQESWSASINPKGAWFCEVAGALSDLFDGPEGWKVEPGWWMRTTKDFTAQRDWACRKCGAAMPIKRERNSQDVRDDISPASLERLKAIRSRKLARDEYVLHDKFEFDNSLLQTNGYPNQTYKDMEYRQGIARRYGIFLTINERKCWEPHLMEQMPAAQPPLFNILQERFGGAA